MGYIRRTILLLATISTLFATAGLTTDAVKKVAILPFQINAPEDLSYMREGIMDMLDSRLSWAGKVEVIEKQAVKDALAGQQGMLNEAAAREVGKTLGADYVLFGSLTVFGDSVSIDAKMVALKEDSPPVTVYAQTKGMSEVIPRINDFAQNINSKFFGRGVPAVAAAPEQPRFSQAHPEKLLIPGAPPPQVQQPQAQQPQSELNPYFIVPATPPATGGFWQSQSLEEAVTSLTVADVNQDNIPEIILLSPGSLCIYQQAPTSLHLIKKYEGDREDHFLWVSTGDLNGNGIPEIYVSNRRREQLMSSFVLEWNGSDWVRTAESIRYHLRAMELPGKGTVLLGQASREDEPFSGGIYIMKKVEAEFQPFEGLGLPPKTRIYGFNLADLTGNGSTEVLVLDRSNKLTISAPNEETLWESNDQFAASFDYLKGIETSPAARLGVEEREKIYLNAPIVIADLNGDQRPEVLVNKNITGLLGGRSFINVNFFGQSELYSLSWNGLTMVEDWHTPNFPGMTTAYQVADLNGDGAPELLVALVSDPGTAVWKKAKSKVVAYPIATGGKTAEGKS
jgi:TolB-like protein